MRDRVCFDSHPEFCWRCGFEVDRQSRHQRNLSTNPTIRQQQLLCDPSGPDEPLILTYAKLDVHIHLDTPLGFNAQDIIQSINVSALAPHFFPVGTMPFYNAGGGSSGVTFDGRDVLIHDFTVQWNTDNPPAPGEVDHALVDVQYNDVLPKDIYSNVLATYTVQSGPLSEIRGRGADSGDLFSFGPDNIIPATDGEPLGVPEPATVPGRCPGRGVAHATTALGG